MFFEEELAGNVVKYHDDGRSDNFGEHVVQVELVDEEVEQEFCNTESDEVENDKFSKEATPGLFRGGVKYPENASKIAKNSRGGE